MLVLRLVVMVLLWNRLNSLWFMLMWCEWLGRVMLGCVVNLVVLISMLSVLFIVLRWMRLLLCILVSVLLVLVLGVMWIVVGMWLDVLDMCLLVSNVMWWLWFCSRVSVGVSLCSFGMLLVCGFWKCIMVIKLWLSLLCLNVLCILFWLLNMIVGVLIIMWLLGIEDILIMLCLRLLLSRCRLLLVWNGLLIVCSMLWLLFLLDIFC